MSEAEDPFVVLKEQPTQEGIQRLARRAGSARVAQAFANIAILKGFDLCEQPLLADLEGLPGEVVPAMTTVPLSTQLIGRRVVVLFDRGDIYRPIITGVLQGVDTSAPASLPSALVLQVDGERHEICAERELVLRCGDASITLTRAGKIIIKGRYIVSRSSGYNKLKGAAIEIN